MVQFNEFPGWDRYVNGEIKPLSQTNSVHESAQNNPSQQQGRSHVPQPPTNQPSTVIEKGQTSSQQTIPKVVHDHATLVNPGAQSQSVPSTRLGKNPTQIKNCKQTTTC